MIHAGLVLRLLVAIALVGMAAARRRVPIFPLVAFAAAMLIATPEMDEATFTRSALLALLASFIVVWLSRSAMHAYGRRRKKSAPPNLGR